MGMNAHEFTRLLITGSRKMDQIKSEVCAAMALVRYAVRKVGNRMQSGSKLEFQIEFDGFEWYFKASLGPKPLTTEIMILCTAYPHGKANGGIRAYEGNSRDGSDVNTIFACDVYNGLPTLIGKLLSELPKLEQELAPFIRASKADLYQ